MLIVQMTGLSGSGKSTIAGGVADALRAIGHATTVVDGDAYRQTLCRDLGFSRADRMENIRRLGKAAAALAAEGNIAIIAAINPFGEVRNELLQQYGALIVHIDCSLEELQRRDTKGLYKRALLPDEHPDKLTNLTGVNDVYEIPVNPHLHLPTDTLAAEACIQMLKTFILQRLS